MNTRSLRGLAAVCALLAPAIAQCPTGSTLTAGGQASSPTGSIFAMVAWDPDGSGPLGPHIVCGGEFQYAGTAATANIAMLDTATRTWSALGAGFDGPVRALAVSAVGELVAAGSFAQSGAVAVSRLARWNGTAWSPIGTGTDGDVHAAAFASNGDLFVGGSFTTAGGTPAANVARWNGATWSALGSGVSGLPPFPVPPPNVIPVSHLGVRSNGDVIIAGAFTSAGGLAVNGIARWNGAWSTLGAGFLGRVPTALQVLANDDVVVGGDNLAGSYQAQRWNGATWTQLGGASPIAWQVFVEQANGTLLAHRLDPFTGLGELQRWNGTQWVLANGPRLFGPAAALLATGNELWLAGPSYSQALPTMRHFDGQTWRAPAPGLDGGIAGAVAFGGSFAIGGYATQIGSVAMAGVAVRQNGTWSALGTPLDGDVHAMLATRSGELLVGGSYNTPPAPGSRGIIRWDGQQWQALGTPSATVVTAIAEGPDGAIYIGGYTPFVERWNGTSWQSLGPLPSVAQVAALAVLQNGEVVVGLRFAAGPKVLRWNGSGWLPLGNGLDTGTPFDEVDALCVLPDGSLVAGGRGLANGGPLYYIARWEGTSWQPMGAGLPSAVRDLDLLPNGDLLATHDATDDLGQLVASPSRWNGTGWTVVPGIGTSRNHGVFRTAIDDRGEVLFTGSFLTANGVVAGGLASLRTNCPPGRQPAGAGCTGSAGPVSSTIVGEAWLGGSWRARATNLPAASLAIHVFGVGSVTLPLTSVLPMALPGCTLHVSPDLLLLDLPVAGVSTASWLIPRTPSLLAQTFRHQVVPLELGPGFVFTAVSASNAWAMTIGAW
ncbi:MAG: hypothetical protein MUC36_15310 [Planctomycetes bacterium]|jgi:hypothetical protein|nr:hypothetical protein [Planctomycetota bacterium]